MRSIREIAVHHQTVFLRVDFNVPLDDRQHITDDTRLKAALPTIEYLLEKKARVIVASHLGRPQGKVVPALRLQPVAQRLSELLGQEVQYARDCVGAKVVQMKTALKPGAVLLLENLRFYNAEKKNDLRFAEQLADGVDVYINDAFGVIHREHASVCALPSLIFDKGIGFLMQEEIEALIKIIQDPAQPLVVVIGGAKISDKVDMIRNVAPMSDVVLVGGGVANVFLKGTGVDVQASLVESDTVAAGQDSVDYAPVALDIYTSLRGAQPTIKVESAGLEAGFVGNLSKIQIPVDAVVAPNTEAGVETKVIEIGKENVPQGWMILDIGPKTRALYSAILKRAHTVFWSGPMGLFEQEAYAAGTRAMAQAIANVPGYTVLGGGDTEIVVKKFGLQGRFHHVSTGGGASLAFLAQKDLPGLKVLE